MVNDYAIIGTLAGSLELALKLSAPIACAALVAGVAAAVIQTVTSVHEQNLSLFSKLAGAAVALWATGPWILHELVGFTRALLSDFSRFIN